MPFGGNIGMGEIIIVLVIALIVLGPKRLPDAARSLGRGIREFRTSIAGATSGGRHDEDEDFDAPLTRAK
ncbi:twin-arginine translocase TatA/TatE family subunit [Solirubrobacter sp. CPCC 204708]|uniref:Sec-independent protein translocase protein TatA n=1 Tax=Solirubrobacter deserti TaxID=2282478 RepID=A0ABT4RUT1_9ACTN|nr:twin-arginine translocase TatA/TatE family subunit [Solirubrobacter deserti]MBE2320188.1 twin-arginine translocase TatA/TatE family subunit [Solirubrobacter deserti]MDA0142235.1 twin-arginine translocase TatA/TatE family subunit [Solirubrobacter deserti]